MARYEWRRSTIGQAVRILAPPAKSLEIILLSAVALGQHPGGLLGQVVDEDAGWPLPEVTINALSPRAISLQVKGPPGSNVIAIRSSEGILVIDTESSPSLGALVRDRILEEFPGETIRAVINTHGHGDHTWGNQAFGDVEIIGQDRAIADMQEVEDDASGDAERIGDYLVRLEARLDSAIAGSPEAEELLQTLSYFATAKEGLETGFRSTPPNVTFSEELTLNLGDISLHLLAFPQAHSRSDILVYCPEEGILATGDLFVSRMRPPYVKSATVQVLPTWIEALNRVLDGSSPVRFVIPGHGDFLSRDDLLEVSEYLVSERNRIDGKTPAFPLFERVLEEDGPESALAYLEALTGSADHFLMEADLVGLGYGFLYREGDPSKAVLVFQALTRLFPDSWNAWDCLGEASVEAGNQELAERSYRRSLELNPANDHAIRALRELR